MNINELIKEYDELPEDGSFNESHPIFQMCEHIDALSEQRDELLAQNERLRTILTRVTSCDELIFNSDVVLAVDSELKNDIEDALNETPVQSLEALKKEWQAEQRKRDALIMARSRGIIKAHKQTSNGRLCSDVFGLGCGTGRDYCRELGLDPDSNETVYAKMIDHLNDLSSGVVK